MQASGGRLAGLLRQFQMTSTLRAPMGRLRGLLTMQSGFKVQLAGKIRGSVSRLTGYAYTFPSGGPPPLATVSGTVTGAWYESHVVSGVDTLIVTLANDTWVAAGATFDAQRAAIRDGVVAATSPANGWNAVRSTIPVTAVVRTSATVVTITIPALPSFSITANQTLTVTVPASALTGGGAVVATPTMTIINVASSATFDYYIGPSGSDGNPGTLASPWAITSLNTKGATYAGKRVGLLDGTYNLLTIMGMPTGGGEGYDTNRLNIAAGSSGSPTVVKAVTRHAAIIDGARDTIGAGTDWQRGLIGPAGDYVTIDGLKLQQANYRTVVNYAAAGDYLTVQNCYFTDQFYITGSGGGQNSSSLFMQNVNGCLVRNCRFDLGGAPIDSNRHAFIQIYKGDDCVVEYCSITGNVASGNPGRSSNLIHFKGNPGGTLDRPGKRYIVRWCYLDNAAVASQTSLRWHANVDSPVSGTESCYGNIIIVNNRECLESEGCSAMWDIYSNTFIGAGTMAEAGVDHLNLDTPTQVNVHRNIFSRTGLGSRGDMSLPTIAQLGTMDYNCYDSSPNLTVRYNNDGATATGLAAWQAASSLDASSTAVSDPLFVASGSEAAYYQLQSGSAAKTLGPGSTEVGAWNSGQDAYGIGYQTGRT